MIRHDQILDDLLSRARWQVKAVEALSQTLAQQKQGLRRLYWAAQLDAIRDRAKREVEFAQATEAASCASYNEGKLISAVVMFSVGILKAKKGQVHEEPLLAGLRHSAQYVRRTAPFGTVMVLVGKRGLFGDVRVLSISQMARVQRQPEADVIAAIRTKGGSLMTPEAFFQMIQNLRQKVLNGSVTIRLVQPRALPCREGTR